MNKDEPVGDEFFSRDIRETKIPYSERGMSNEQIAKDSVKDLRAGLAEAVSANRISPEAADKVIADQASYQKQSLDNRSGSAGQLADNKIAGKKLGVGE